MAELNREPPPFNQAIMRPSAALQASGGRGQREPTGTRAETYNAKPAYRQINKARDNLRKFLGVCTAGASSESSFSTSLIVTNGRQCEPSRLRQGRRGPGGKPFGRKGSLRISLVARQNRVPVIRAGKSEATPILRMGSRSPSKRTQIEAQEEGEQQEYWGCYRAKQTPCIYIHYRNAYP
jgi:hypothetical protein